MAPRRVLMAAAGSQRAAAAVVVGVATSSEGILVASSSAAAVDTSTASALYTATTTAGESVAISAATGTFRQKQHDVPVRPIFGKDTSEPAGEVAVDVPAATFFASTLAATDKPVTSSTFFPFPSASASTGVINDAIVVAPIAAGIYDAIRDRDTSTSPKCHVSLRIEKTTTAAAGRDTVDAGNTSTASRQGEYYSFFFLADDANDDDASSDELDGDHAILWHVEGPAGLCRHRSSISSGSGSSLKTEVLIVLSVAGIVLSLASLFIFLYFNNNNNTRRRRRPPWKHNIVVSPEAYQPAASGTTASSPSYEQLSGTKSWFTYDELAGITGGFAAANVIGEGGFGKVYMGTLPAGAGGDERRRVAVKQLKVGGGQGEKEFRAEVDIISRIHHRHLVTLVGYCVTQNHRLLVYEFVSNKTLDHHLHGRS
nr:unnamed protein product [Digitaria exilis]